ncbi:protein of unknown function [Magnetospirillum sp. XM-1]|nr:protein of unknown function [Magnetospirillum sp. XM-1]
MEEIFSDKELKEWKEKSFLSLTPGAGISNIID